MTKLFVEPLIELLANQVTFGGSWKRRVSARLESRRRDAATATRGGRDRASAACWKARRGFITLRLPRASRPPYLSIAEWGAAGGGGGCGLLDLRIERTAEVHSAGRK